MRLQAPAKINLHLRVGAVRSDGFHPLLSWMTTVALFDTLLIDDAPGGIELICDERGIQCDGTNLIVRAAELLNPGSFGMRAHLNKRIPIGGGLGGGSSDAARTLLGLNRLWRLDWSAQRLLEIAAHLGSDVPYFLFGPSAICQGRGEIVQPVSRPRAHWAVLILPQIAMRTAEVYKKFDALGPGKAESLLGQPSWQEWASLSSGALLPRLINDLEPAAFALSPELCQLRDKMEQTLGRIVRMSGSGSTLFTLFDDASAAESAAEIVARHGVRCMAVELAVQCNDDLEN